MQDPPLSLSLILTDLSFLSSLMVFHSSFVKLLITFRFVFRWFSDKLCKKST